MANSRGVVDSAVKLLMAQMGFKPVTVQLAHTHPDGTTEINCLKRGNLHCMVSFMEMPTMHGEIKDWVIIEYADSEEGASVWMFEDGGPVPLDIPLSEIVAELKNELEHSMSNTGASVPLQGTVEPLGSWDKYIYVAVLSRYQGRLLLSRHRQRTTWETQGGHIEPGETPEQAARRELYEEAGALDFTLTPMYDYSAAGTHGVFFVADISTLGPLPESEMAEVRLFDRLPPPPQLTYPGITPVLFARVMDYFKAD